MARSDIVRRRSAELQDLEDIQVALPGKAGHFSSISAKTQPMLQTSTFLVYSVVPSRGSGARKLMVTTFPVYWRTWGSLRRASPKSAVLSCGG